MTIAASIRQRVNEPITLLPSQGQNIMIIGGIASNVSSIGAYLSIKPFLVNARIEPNIPFQLQTKTLLSSGQILRAWASDSPASIDWNSSSIDDWNSGYTEDWNSASIDNNVSVFLDLTIAEI